MKRNSPDKLILGHVNINSIRNMFDALTYIIGNNIDIILISVTKIDHKFPTAQFFIKGFSAPYRKQRNRTGGGLLLSVREDGPSKILNPKSKTDIETLSVEINSFRGLYIVPAGSVSRLLRVNRQSYELEIL